MFRTINFSLSTTLPASYYFSVVVFLFTLISKCFLSLHMIYYLTQWLSGSVLFNIHIFPKFSSFLWFVISFFCGQRTYSVCKFIKTCLWYALMDIQCTPEKMCILLFLGGVCNRFLSDLVGFIVWSKSSVFFLFCCLVFSIHYWKLDIEVSNYYSWVVYISVQFCQFLLHVFWSSFVRCNYFL